MARLNPEQIYAVALRAGFDPHEAVTFTAIALAESGGDPSANAAGSEDSRGLWQINVSAGVRTNRWGDLYDPAVNARAAYEVSRGGTDIRPWSVTHASNAGSPRDYRQYLDEAQQAAAAIRTGGTAGGLPVPSTATTALADGAHGADVFVDSALAQVGDRYVYGTDVSLADPDPRAFDCSELVQWAAHRAGVDLGEATYLQYLELKDQGGLVEVDRALRTRGALLFTFSSEPTPGGGRPSQAHVAISLGDGRVVEAASEHDGVTVSPAGHRFNYAAVIPGLATAVPDASDVAMPAALPDPTDSDGDGLTDEFEALLGTDPHSVDTDHDDLSDLYETTRSHTDPLAVDTDHDLVADAVEVATGSDAGEVRLSDEVVAHGFGGAATADIDHDDLPDLLEQQLGSNRDVADTDLDGVSDGMEYALGSNLTSIDSDHDGITDGVELGTGTLGPALPLAAGTADAAAGGLSDLLDDAGTHGGHDGHDVLAGHGGVDDPFG